MKRGVVTLVAALVGLACVGAGVGTWLLVRRTGPQQPEISAYSHGHLTRVGPYLYCDVLNLNDCQSPQAPTTDLRSSSLRRNDCHLHLAAEHRGEREYSSTEIDLRNIDAGHRLE